MEKSQLALNQKRKRREREEERGGLLTNASNCFGAELLVAGGEVAAGVDQTFWEGVSSQSYRQNQTKRQRKIREEVDY